MYRRTGVKAHIQVILNLEQRSAKSEPFRCKKHDLLLEQTLLQHCLDLFKASFPANLRQSIS